MLLLLFAGVLLKLSFLSHPVIPTESIFNGVLTNRFIQGLSAAASDNPLLWSITAFSMLYIQALWLVYIFNRNRMYNRQNYLVGLAYMLVTSFFKEWNTVSGLLLANFLLIYIFSKLFSINTVTYLRETIFNIGLCLGIALFVYPPSVIFIFWALLSLVIQRPFKSNEWLICILGILTPVYFYAAYLFFWQKTDWRNALPDVDVALPVLVNYKWQITGLALLVASVFTGLFFIRRQQSKMVIQIRKGWDIVLIYLGACLLLVFINAGSHLQNIFFILLPVAVYLAAVFLYNTSKITNLIIFWLLVAFVVANQYFGMMA